MKSGNSETIRRKSYKANTQLVSTINAKLVNDFEAVGSVLKPHLELCQSIQKGRLTHQPPLTQHDLDKLCNFPLNTIKNYENGTAKYVSEHVTRMERVLKIRLPRPKKTIM